MSHKLYNHIADEICRRIADGVYAAGGKLPAHRELAAEFKVLE
ncbi:MAG: GntR family transcriptional regulator [Lentisphaerae bacterium]|nr:GntR family transcriptional regulator [Lentisphaerota bacterium]